MLDVRPITDKLGAEIAGVDLKRVDDEVFAEIHEAFLKHIVLVFRGQTLATEDFLEFGRRFGPLRPHIVQKSRQFYSKLVASFFAANLTCIS